MFYFFPPGWRLPASLLLVLSCLGLLSRAALAQTAPTFDIAVRVLAPSPSGQRPFSHDVAVDANGNGYTSGSFYSAVRFDNRTITATSGNDVYLAKTDATGKPVWIVTIAAAINAGGGPGGNTGTSLAVDASGNVYIAGSFTTPTLRLGGTTLTNAGGSDLFVAKLDAGGTWLWAVPAGGQQDDRTTGFALGPFATPYVAGEHFSPTASFGPLTVPGEVVFSGSSFLARMQPNRLRISGDSVLCSGGTAQLTASTLGTGIGWRWNTGATTPTIAVAQPGTYGVVLTYPGGCTSRDSLRVRAAPTIPAAATLGADTTLCLEQPLLLRAPLVAGPGVTLRWADGSRGPTLTVREPGTYSLQIRTSCDSLTLRRRVAYVSCLVIPNVITPNGDRQNDRFALQNLPRGDWALTLYNRWGRQVYHTNTYQQDWGPDAAAGTYYYLLRHATDNVSYKGWVEVVR